MSRGFEALSESIKPHQAPSISPVRRRILCATDLTPRGDRAVQRAALLAKQTNAEVLFVHIVDDRQPERVVNLKANRARLRLTLQAERTMGQSFEQARVEIHLGKKLKVIADLAREWSADLIVLAAPIQRRYEKFFGTTAERIIRAAQCPVLIVQREPLASYSEIALATDLSSASLRAARAVAKMGIVDGAFTWVVHALELPLERFGETARQRETRQASWEQLVRVRLTPDLEDAGFDLSRVKVLVQPARPLDAIEHILENVQPELLVIGTSRWFMLKRMLQSSVAHQVLSRATCDILAVPARALERPNRSKTVSPGWTAASASRESASPVHI